jgi:predicted DCC family thiol-disulfide oxidoreductase YuxK
MAEFLVIYDGNCNLCSSLVQGLEQIEGGDRLRYAPMQDEATLRSFAVSPADCEAGMWLIDLAQPDRRWQGSAAAEEIGRLLGWTAPLINLYRRLPGFKPLGDRAYLQVRDHRYAWFGRRTQTYWSRFPWISTPLGETERAS